MADELGTGEIVGPIDALRQIIAGCPSWQAWCETSDSAVGLAHTYRIGLPLPEKGANRDYRRDELEALRPFAIVDTSPFGENFNLTLYTEDGGYLERGNLLVIFEVPVPEADLLDEAAAKWNFLVKLGAFVSEMRAAMGQGLRITTFGIDESARTAVEDLETQGDRWIVLARVGYAV